MFNASPTATIANPTTTNPCMFHNCGGGGRGGGSSSGRGGGGGGGGNGGRSGSSSGRLSFFFYQPKIWEVGVGQRITVFHAVNSKQKSTKNLFLVGSFLTC